MPELRFQNILVATDLSVTSSATYGHAVAFARAFDAGVTLLHVDESEEHGPTADSDDSSELAQQRSAAAGLMDEQLARVEANFVDLGVSVAIERATGNASRQILERADSDRFDLLMIAKHGAGDRKAAVLGLTAERVVHNARIPVIVGYHPTPQLGEVANYQRLGVCTDYSEDSRLGIRRVQSLAERFDAWVEVVHAVPSKAQPSGDGETQKAWRENFAKAQTVDLNREHAEELAHPRTAGRVQVGPRIPETVVAGALEAKADLLCVPSHGKGAVRRAFFGSSADRVVRLAPIPSMIMPGQWLRG